MPTSYVTVGLPLTEKKIKMFPKKTPIKALVLLLFAALLNGCGHASVSQPSLADASEVTPENTLVLVTGITGNQGGGVAEALLAQGFQVRGMSRNISSDRSKALIARGVEMVQADFTDYGSTTSAVQGVDQMFLNITEQTTNYIDAAKHIIDSAYEAGVTQIVFTSNIPANPESGFNVNPERTKRMIELHLRESGHSYTTLRIPFLMENLMRDRNMQSMLTEGVVEYGEDNTVGYYINGGDIGLLAAAAFANPLEWAGREVNMASDAVSSRELVALISELSGREISYRVAAWSEMRGPFVPNFQFFETLERSDYDIDEIRRSFPQVKTLKEYLISQDYGAKIRALADSLSLVLEGIESLQLIILYNSNIQIVCLIKVGCSGFSL